MMPFVPFKAAIFGGYIDFVDHALLLARIGGLVSYPEIPKSGRNASGCFGWC